MRIGFLLFADFPEGSAHGRRTFLQAKGLAGRGHQVYVLAAQRFRSGQLCEKIDGIQVIWGRQTDETKFHKLPERLKARYSIMLSLKKLIVDGLDWLIMVFPDIDRLPYAIASRNRGVNLIATYDDSRKLPPDPSIYQRYISCRANLADRMIPRLSQINFVASTFLQTHLQRIAPGRPSIIIPPLVDLDAFAPDIRQAELFRTKNNIGRLPLIAYLGTYWHVEGIKNLLVASRELFLLGVEFKVIICGKPHHGLKCDPVANLIRALNLGANVIEAGWLPTREMIGVMSAADILVAPKINDSANIAGMPAKLAEYMAMGKAVLASAIGDIPEYVEDGKDIVLCQPGDISSLIEKIKELIGDYALRQRIGKEARITASKKFNYKIIASDMERAIYDFVGKN